MRKLGRQRSLDDPKRRLPHRQESFLIIVDIGPNKTGSAGLMGYPCRTRKLLALCRMGVMDV